MAKRIQKKSTCGTARPTTKSELAVPQAQKVQHLAPCSVEFSRDAKGNPKWAIKLYGEVDEMDHVVDEIKRLDERLRKEVAGGA